MAVRATEVSKWVLRDCSFSLPSGGVTALVGANGAGKTTLLSLLCGLVPPDSGEVAVDGRVAFVAQDKPLYRHFTVRDVLRFGRHTNTKWDEERAQAWLSRFDVPLGVRCGRLSGGQRAQVAIAVALGSTPDVLLLDEPLAELDPLVRKEVTAQLLSAGITIVLSTHVVAELSGVADRLLLLARGELLLDADIDDLLNEHVEVIGPRADVPPASGEVVRATHTDGQSRYLLRGAGSVAAPWITRPVSLEDVVVAHLEAAE